MSEEILYNKIYEKTADCGRTQFIRLLMDKERENQQLKDNWNRLREFILEEGFEINTREYGSLDVIDKNVILEKIQELQGSDSNE